MQRAISTAQNRNKLNNRGLPTLVQNPQYLHFPGLHDRPKIAPRPAVALVRLPGGNEPSRCVVHGSCWGLLSRWQGPVYPPARLIRCHLVCQLDRCSVLDGCWTPPSPVEIHGSDHQDQD